jgi:hypothetical protein
MFRADFPHFTSKTVEHSRYLPPVVSENTLKALVKEFKNTGSQYKQKIYTVMRASGRTPLCGEKGRSG